MLHEIWDRALQRWTQTSFWLSLAMYDGAVGGEPRISPKALSMHHGLLRKEPPRISPGYFLNQALSRENPPLQFASLQGSMDAALRRLGSSAL